MSWRKWRFIGIYRGRAGLVVTVTDDSVHELIVVREKLTIILQTGIPVGQFYNNNIRTENEAI